MDDPHRLGEVAAPPGSRRGFTRFGRWEKQVRFLAVSLVVAVGAAVAILVIRYDSTSGMGARRTSLAVGARAPGFRLPQLGGGAAVTLASAHGRPVVVHFFASWGPDVRKDLHAVATVASTADGKVVTIGIDTNDNDSASAERQVIGSGARFPVGMDPNARVADEYKIAGLPVTYFLNADGTVEHVSFGNETVESLTQSVTRLERAGASAP